MRTLYPLLNVAFIFLCFFLNQTSFAQESTANSQEVTISVDHGGLMCPFLGPQLSYKLAELDGAENIVIHKKESQLTLNLPEVTEVTEEQVKSIAVRVGYPPADVHVIFTKIEGN